MELTDYHAKYFAYELTKRCSSDSLEKLAGALVDAKVDLNPHQVEAALFAFQSPLSKGALLADEVGLGKTIEAGLVISQKWAERKRRILIITPANLRKQWHQEMQEKLNADTEKTLADNLPDRWKRLLWTADPTYTGKDKKDMRTLLQKHLRRYTARHQFDYFIHKDLGGFLRQELDFYIKNEIMHLDDIENVAAPKAEEYLSKIRAIRRCAQPVINMLEQLENFQKKLWLKKKFVVETRYCLTVDRVPESFYEVICKNDAQWAEWEQLYALAELPKELFTAKPRTVEFLKQQQHLMLDTRHFDRDFMLRLLASIDNLDETLDGVCFHAENFQALNLLRNRYREQINCVFIDPPYNTGVDGFPYKDNYQHSSWLDMMENRLALTRLLLAANGLLFMTVDFVEVSKLRLLTDAVLGPDNFLADIAWEKRYTRSNNAKRFYSLKDTVLAYRASEALSVVREGRTEKSKENYTNPDKDPRGPWISSSYVNPATKAERQNLVYKIQNPIKGILVSIPTHAWKYDPETHRQHVEENRLFWGLDGSYEYPRLKSFLCEASEGMVPVDVWKYQDAGTTDDGGKTLKLLFGAAVFDNPKPTTLIERITKLSSSEASESIVLDYFAGSGTTGHAVINLNREDGGIRKCLLIEMGAYFDTVLVPRLKKVVYATDWKDGKPQSHNTGISHTFKIVRLEGYEDTLNNLRLIRTPEQQAALNAAPAEAREGYLISYFLDVESAGSASLLDLDQFRDPFSYTLKIATSSAGETKETPIDLVETFNWLLGLKVQQIDTQRGFLRVIGEKRAGGRTLVIWRTLSDDPVKDNKALDQLLARLQINPADTEFAFIYVNGSHTLADPHNKVHLIEETFARLMFEAQDFETLSE